MAEEGASDEVIKTGPDKAPSESREEPPREPKPTLSPEAARLFAAIDSVNDARKKSQLSETLSALGVIDLSEPRSPELSGGEQDAMDSITPPIHLERDIDVFPYLGALRQAGLSMTHKLAVHAESPHAVPYDKKKYPTPPSSVETGDLRFELVDGQAFANLLKQLTPETAKAHRSLLRIDMDLINQINIEYAEGPSMFNADKFGPVVAELDRLDYASEALTKTLHAAKNQYLDYVDMAEGYGFDYMSVPRTQAMKREAMYDLRDNTDLVRKGIGFIQEVAEIDAAKPFVQSFALHLRNLALASIAKFTRNSYSDEAIPTEKIDGLKQLVLELEFVAS